MKSITNLSTLLMVSVLLLSACQRSGDCGCDINDPYASGKGNLRVSSNIITPSTRVQGEAWEVSDAIGIFALNEGQALGATNYVSNAKYTTATAGSRVAFTSVSEGIKVPTSGNLELIAYYPYKEGTATELSFDVSDQSKPALIDLLYSNNQKGINKDNLNASLVFDHALTMVEFDITSDGLTIDNGTIALKDVLVDGRMALANGTITTGTKSASPSVAIQSAGANKYKAMMILPPQVLTNKEVTFTIDGKEHTATLKIAQTASGYKYIVEVKYTEEGKLLVIDGATINPWKEGEKNGDAIIIGGNVTPTPPTPPTPPVTEAKALFPGADFEDWNAFVASLNKFGVSDAEQADGGRTGKALHINKTITKNGFIFTSLVQSDTPAKASKITFYIKGTATGKSLSFNVYSPSGKYDNGKGVKYDAFNLDVVNSTAEVTLEAKDKNSYNGSIDTKGEWVKVTLNVSSTQLPTSGDLFAVKVGKDGVYDLRMDDFTIE